jgi:hypothetical protein
VNYFGGGGGGGGGTIKVAAPVESAEACLLLPAIHEARESPSRLALEYVGTDGDWFNADNWDAGRVPGPDDVVLLDGDDDVQINQSGESKPIQIKVGFVEGNARLTTMPGTIFIAQREVVRDNALLVHRASAVLVDESEIGNDAALGLSCRACNANGAGVHAPTPGIVMNPTAQSKRTVVLQSSFVSFGLGGTTPASITRDAAGGLVVVNGPGTYATLEAQVARLGNGTTIAPNIEINRLVTSGLVVTYHYGFLPSAGDAFQILTAGQRAGTFPNLPEGAGVDCQQNVALFITYEGGDGNDVVLNARDVDPATCAAIAVPNLLASRRSAN